MYYIGKLEKTGLMTMAMSTGEEENKAILVPPGAGKVISGLSEFSGKSLYRAAGSYEPVLDAR